MKHDQSRGAGVAKAGPSPRDEALKTVEAIASTLSNRDQRAALEAAARTIRGGPDTPLLDGDAASAVREAFSEAEASEGQAAVVAWVRAQSYALAALCDRVDALLEEGHGLTVTNVFGAPAEEPKP